MKEADSTKKTNSKKETQLSLLDMQDCHSTADNTGFSCALNSSKDEVVRLDENIIAKLNNYSLKDYCQDIEKFGIEKTWNDICEYLLKYGEGTNDCLLTKNFAEMYEIALEIQCKEQKKQNGQYCTPEDVAYVMAQWLDKLEAQNICDVACGTGQLILAFLDLIGQEKALEIIENGRLYLYDVDKTALKICKTTILLKYGKNFKDAIHDVCCDFLDEKVILPKDCKVISNPPYASIKTFKSSWRNSKVLSESKELYSAFMEKILIQSKRSVIITPYSFISGDKFYSLRHLMNDYNGFVVSFDNVPGNIFCGRKHGVFNTNTSNSVRAAITVAENVDKKRGFKLSPLIRFKSAERKQLLQCDVLENFVFDEYQIVDETNTRYFKCDKSLGKIFESWMKKSSKKLCDFVSEQGQYLISMPNTCRYYTTASNQLMKRNGQICVKVRDESAFYFIYCLINSSFAYWFWRLYDGGITYQKGLLMQLPIFYDLLSKEDVEFFKETAQEMIAVADKFIIKKNNVGIQENIKFPRAYRDKINKKLLEILQVDVDEKQFDVIHSNMALEVNV